MKKTLPSLLLGLALFGAGLANHAAAQGGGFGGRFGAPAPTPVPSAVPAVVAPGAQVKKLAGGFKFTEGPTCDAKGNVFFVDQDNDSILEWSVDGKLSTWMKPAGRSNGMCFDKEGNLWSCADEKNALWRIAPDKKVTVVVKDFEGKLLNGPNDVWVAPSGGMYLTDPFFGRAWWQGFREPVAQMDKFVYYLAPDHKKLTRVSKAMGAPNGVIGTPDGKTLYVADMNGRRTYAYDVQPDGSLKNERTFCNVGSDGMTIDNEGNVYLTSGRYVQVFDKEGKLIQRISVPEMPANVCFGGKDRKTLFITARTGLYAVDTRTTGVGAQ